MTITTKLHKRTTERFGRKDRPVKALNDCFRPSAEASKADLAEFHAEDMKLRRAKQRALTRNAPMPPRRKNDDEEWRNREFRR